jgi:hypothetical protein
VNNSAGLCLNPAAIFEMATGFWVSKTLMCAVELDIFSKLSERSLSVDQIQQLFGLRQRQAEPFIASLSSLGLLTCAKHNENGELQLFANSELADTFLVREKPLYIGDFVTMYDQRLYNRWDDLLLRLKCGSMHDTGSPALKQNITKNYLDELYSQSIHNTKNEKVANSQSNLRIQKEMKMFVHAMYGEKIWEATALCQIYDFSKHRKLIDLGGGPAVFPIQIVKHFSNIFALVIDTEPVCMIADEYIKKFNLEDRIETMVLDLLNEDLPNGYDLILISHIIGGMNKETGASFLQKAYNSLCDNGGGTVMVNEWLLNDDKSGPLLPALMGLNMTVETREGKAYSFAEIYQMLSETGFREIEKIPIPGSPGHIILGHK